MKIITALQVKLTEGEQFRVWYKKKKPPDIKAYEKILQARGHFFRMNPEGNAMARQRAKEAIEIDPTLIKSLELCLTFLLSVLQRECPTKIKQIQSASSVPCARRG